MTPPVPGPRIGLNAAVAAELRAEMARQRISARELAESSRVPYGTLRRYLAAERHVDVAVLYELATALGVDAAAVVATAQAHVGDATTTHLEPADRAAAIAEGRRVAADVASAEQTGERAAGRESGHEPGRESG